MVNPLAPTVRFAVTTAMTETAHTSGRYRYPFHKDNMPPIPPTDPPTVRLATNIDACGPNGSLSNTAFERHLAAPSVKLAHVPGAQGDNNLIGQRGVAALPETSLPALLVSYYYLDAWVENQHKYHYRDWVMDSGAFSAHNSGAVIVLQEYIDCCKRLMASDPTLTEIYSLDVIGSWEEGLKNTEEMWRQGVPAIPCFHYGEPWELLKYLCANYPKVAIGGCVGKRDKDEFAGQCFARSWPKKFHGFGFGSEKSIMLYPWHSVDATNWELAPCKFGTWKAFDGQRVSVRGSQQNLRAEVEWYLDLERRARTRWKKEMQKLEQIAPTVRLALGSDRSEESVKTFLPLQEQ